MKDQTSFGSQFQYRPQADSAQMAPAMTPKVQIGKAKAWTRKVTRSRTSAWGRRSPREYGKLRLPVSWPMRMRCMAAATNPTRKMPDAIEAAPTWMTSQYECRAGTRG